MEEWTEKKYSEFGKNDLDLKENTGSRIKQDSCLLHMGSRNT